MRIVIILVSLGLAGAACARAGTAVVHGVGPRAAGHAVAAPPHAPGGRWRAALDFLNSRAVQARIEKSLLGHYHIPAGKAGGFKRLNGINFSKDRFPIRLNADEEWPPVIGGCLYLLRGAEYRQAANKLKRLAAAPVKRIPTIQRVLIQNGLWDVFDSLYLEGISPWHPVRGKARQRWRTLLFWLARDMARIGVGAKALAPFRTVGAVRRRILGPKLWRKAVQIYSYQQPTIHAEALGFRRIVRIYLYDPKVDFARLPQKQLATYVGSHGAPGWHAGGVAIEVEDAIALAPRTANLVPTRIPVIARSYRVVFAGHGQLLLRFSIYRLGDHAATVGTSSLKRLPGDLGTWALLNLPTIPSWNGGYLARYPVVCGQCHNPTVIQSFRSGIGRPRARYFRLTRGRGQFVRLRSLRVKAESPGYNALQFYWAATAPPHAGER